MARNYARFITAIWDEDDWCALDAFDQWLYFMLSTQEDISAAGRLKMIEREWSLKSANTKESDIVSGLERLDAAQFIVADFDTFEVLIRAFVRIDGGFTNAKRRPVILRDAELFRSRRAREVLSAEFARVGLPPLTADRRAPDVRGDVAPHVVLHAVPDAAFDAVPDTAYPESPFGDDPKPAQVDAASHAASHAAPLGNGRVPQPATHNPREKNKEPKSILSATATPPPDDDLDRLDVKALCTKLVDCMTAIDIKVPATIPASWGRDARLLLDRDGRDLQKSLLLIEWALADSFWRRNIHSIPKFREQYDKLRLAANDEWTRKHTPSTNGRGVAFTNYDDQSIYDVDPRPTTPKDAQ